MVGLLLCVTVFVHYYLLGSDIAFNKPAYASSAFNDQDKYGPQFVNNGQAVCDNAAGPIAHTRIHEYNPWFKVDLQGTFNIKTVSVLPRISKCLY